MLIHGFMGCPEDFTPIAERLSVHYTCIAPCLKGHGHAHRNTKVPLPYGLQAQAVQIETILNQACIDAVYAVGYSLGGRVALQWALGLHQSSSPEGYFYNPRLKALCLTAAHVGLDPNAPIRQARFAQDLQIAKRLETVARDHASIESWEAFLNYWYALPLFGRLQHHPNYAALMQRRRAHDPHILAEVVCQASSALQQDYRSDLARLARILPCLYVAGSEDHKYAELATELAQAGVPAALMPHLAHALPTEDSTRYGLLLQQFFASLRQ